MHEIQMLQTLSCAHFRTGMQRTFKLSLLLIDLLKQFFLFGRQAGTHPLQICSLFCIQFYLILELRLACPGPSKLCCNFNFSVPTRPADSSFTHYGSILHHHRTDLITACARGSGADQFGVAPFS